MLPESLLAATIRWESVGPLLIASLAIMGSPGPATISLTAAGSAYGVRRSFAYLVGIIVGTTIVLVAVATLYLLQRSLLYPIPQATRTSPAAAGFAEAEEVVADTADGERVVLWHVPPKGDRPVSPMPRPRTQRPRPRCSP